MLIRNGRTGRQTVTKLPHRFGLAVGARKMIDSEYDHAADSLSSGLYVRLLSCRSPIIMEQNAQSAHGWASIPSASADTPFPTIMMHILAKSSIQLVAIVHAKAFDLCPADRRSVECIG